MRVKTLSAEGDAVECVTGPAGHFRLNVPAHDLPVEGRFHVADSSEPALLLVFWSRGSAETSSRLCVQGVF